MALDINLNGVEATANKSTNVNTDQASNTKYPSVKALYDWAVGLFARATRTISTSSPLSGGGDLSADRTLSISQSNTTTNGYLSSTDWNTFNNKLSTSTAGTTYVPYTGATSDVDLGTKEITSGKLHSYGGATVGGNGAGYTNGFLDFFNSSNALFTRLQAGVNTQSITLNLPVANGTVGQNLSLTATNQLGWATPTSLTGYVPYTGATTDLDLGTFNLTADHISLNTNPSGAGFVVGATQWNNTDGGSETLLKGGNVTIKNGVDLVARIVNSTGVALTKAGYQVVKVSGASGQRLAVGLAQANNDLNSADTLGIVAEDISINLEGFILTVGQLLEINTTGSLQGETWADGDVLYLSPSTAGKITNIKPTGSTGHIVVLGYVEYAHSIHGKIYVKIMNGWELDELHNVYINGVANNDLLQYESSTSLWKNKQVTTASIADSTNKRYVTDANLTVIGNTSGTNTGDQTFLNARVQSVTSSATVTPTSLNDLVKITAQAAGLTIANPTGTMSEGQALMIRIKDNGTAQTIAFGTNYRAIGVTLPTTTTISKTIYLGCIWNNTDTKFDILGVNIQA